MTEEGQLSLGSPALGRWTCPRCGKQRLGPRWEVVYPAQTEKLYGLPMNTMTFTIKGPDWALVVCSLCAHDFERKRQLP